MVSLNSVPDSIPPTGMAATQQRQTSVGAGDAGGEESQVWSLDDLQGTEVFVRRTGTSIGVMEEMS